MSLSGGDCASSLPDLIRPTYIRIQFTSELKTQLRIKVSGTNGMGLSGFLDIMRSDENGGVAS